MTEAFRCDFCGDFYQGEPAQELYAKVINEKQGTNWPKVADVCQDCWVDVDARVGDDDD